MRKANLSIVLAALALPGSAFANGFILNDHGAQATGRANAVAATVTNGSAVVYNPGGIPVEDGVNLYLGTSLIFPNSSFTEARSGVTTQTDVTIAATPTLFLHGKVTDLVSLGIGFHTPFGTKLGWPEGAPGTDLVRESSLRTFFITPVAGADLSRWVPGLTVGGGVDVVPATVRLERDIFFGDVVGHTRLGGNGFGVGGRAGVMYRPARLPALSAGAAYRSPVVLRFDGTADVDAPAPFRAELPADGGISTAITLPGSILAGVAFRPLAGLEVELDLQWMQWSTIDEIAIRLEDGTEVTLDRGYEDTLTLRAGAEYHFRSIGVDVRAGYAYDPTPIPRERLTVALPDIDRHVLSAGATYHIPTDLSRLFVDVGVLWVLPGERSTSDAPHQPQLKGTYEVEAWVAAFSIGAKFGGRAGRTPASRPVLAAGR